MNAPAAWHPDPTGRHEHRYWDGERWTEHVADAGVASTDPLNTDLDTDAAKTGDDTANGSSDTTPGGPAEGRADEREAGSAGEAGSTADAQATSPGTDGGFAPLSPIEPPSHEEPTAPGQGPAGPGGPPSYGGSPSSPGFAGGPTGGTGYGPPTAPAAPGPGQAGFGSYPSAAPVDHQPQASNPMAATGMILGIASIVLSWLGVVSRFGGILMLLVAIAAVVVSSMGKSRANKGHRGNGMAITGIVTGIVGIIAVGLFWAGGEAWRAFSDEFTELVECIEETGDEEFCQRQFEDQILDRN